MPALGYEEVVYSGDDPVPLKVSTGGSFFDINFDVIPFNGQRYRGYVKCEGYVIDALRAYSVCELRDKDGNVLFASGWVVDIDPLKEIEVKSYEDTRVKYFIVSRRDFVGSQDLQVSVDDVKEKIQKAAARGSKYVGVVGYIFPVEEFYTEIRENPELKKRREKLISELEEALEKALES